MNILILGSGGREHALAWKIKQSPLCNKLFVVPGNAGTAAIAENINISVNDFEAQKKFALENNIEMIVVGPEEPLVNGVYDYFQNQADWKGIVIGPSKEGAQLEGSKAFSKRFMERHNIPTALYHEFDKQTFEEGKNYIANHPLPIVLKADGLAAGKGVIIAQTHAEAQLAFEEMILGKQFGEASAKVVIEQFLAGIEISVFVLTDGRNYKIIGHAKDYKRIGEGDTGLNTGGMGCVSPVPFADAAFMKKVEEKIIAPTINGLASENITYKGFVFFGLIKVGDEPWVIEYNCRMGDPETEVVMPRLKNDLVELFLSVSDGSINNIVIETKPLSMVTIVAVSGGYPGDYKKNLPISQSVNESANTLVFHCGTKKTENDIVTNGGRVLAVTSFGEDIQKAAQQSLVALEKIHFDGMYYRKDIGYEFK